MSVLREKGNTALDKTATRIKADFSLKL